MRYHFKHEITHQSTLVSDKVNYFADYFDFALKSYGLEDFPELENHKSLLEKIKFQLDNFTKYSNTYVRHYFNNSFLTKSDWLIEEFYSTEWKRIAALKNDLDFTDHALRTEMRLALTSLIESLDETIFQNAMSSIIKAIMCDKPLHEHQHMKAFEYYTKIILSEFLFAGFPKEDLQLVFNKILARDVEFENSVVETNAPLPKSILDKRNDPDTPPEVFYQMVSEYLSNRNLQQQFEGIYHIFKNSSNKKTYVFKLSNLKAYNSISIEYNGVFISNQLKEKYVIKGVTASNFANFFEEEGVIFAEFSVNENNAKVGKSNALVEIRKALNYLNATLSKKAGIRVDEYILSADGVTAKYRNSKSLLDSEDVKILAKHNQYTTLDNTNKLAMRFLQLDDIYYQSIIEERIEFKVVENWRYMESFFSVPKSDAKYIKETISKILSRNSLIALPFNYFRLASPIIYSAYQRPIKSIFDRTGINKFLNISDEEVDRLCHPGDLRNIDFVRINQVLKQPFLNKKIKWLLKSTEEEKIKVSYDFYLKILTEAYEQRNLIQHSGVHNKKAIEKVLLTLPNMVKEFRKLITRELKTGNYVTFNEIFDKLLQDTPC